MSNQPNIPLKECTRCNEKLPKTEEHFRIERENYKKKNGDVVTYSYFKAVCKKCHKSVQKKYREENQEKIKKDRKKNRKKYRETRKKWQDKNRKKMEKWQKKYREENRESIRKEERKQIKELADNYIVKVLAKGNNIDRDEIRKIPELIELKRIQIKTNRLIKSKGL